MWPRVSSPTPTSPLPTLTPGAASRLGATRRPASPAACPGNAHCDRWPRRRPRRFGRPPARRGLRSCSRRSARSRCAEIRHTCRARRPPTLRGRGGRPRARRLLGHHRYLIVQDGDAAVVLEPQPFRHPPPYLGRQRSRCTSSVSRHRRDHHSDRRSSSGTCPTSSRADVPRKQRGAHGRAVVKPRVDRCWVTGGGPARREGPQLVARLDGPRCGDQCVVHPEPLLDNGSAQSPKVVQILMDASIPL